MEFNQQDNQQNSIISTDNEEIKLSHASLAAPCFISANHYQNSLNISLEKLSKQDLFPLCTTDDIDILIIGTGEKTQFLQAKQQVEIRQMGIGVESMNSKSACRSFNLLLADARRVGLLLLC
ncbi:MAG: hypothetical protein FXV79_05590 [Candidatus Thioglobus sp.]|nr:MAG: hypothetical protein FXV80_04015 [Candidatus Thioglobus sp.]KAA0446332.1 MAG: hypothetical protein FXV79_05590 [Candidatus Thioglobus sp.]